jgi:hypothetical protein
MTKICLRRYILNEASQSAKESRARREARKVGLIAQKSRSRANSIDNKGGFRILDPYFNRIEAGIEYGLSPEAVIAFCERNTGFLKR